MCEHGDEELSFDEAYGKAVAAAWDDYLDNCHDVYIIPADGDINKTVRIANVA